MNKLLLAFFVLFAFAGRQLAYAQDTLVLITGEMILVKDLSLEPPILHYRWLNEDTTLKSVSLESIDHLRLSNPSRPNEYYSAEQAIALKVSDSVRSAKGLIEGRKDELKAVPKLIFTIGMGSLMTGASIFLLDRTKGDFASVVGGVFSMGLGAISTASTIATPPYTSSMIKRLNKTGMLYDQVYCKSYIKSRQEQYLKNLLIVSGLGIGSAILINVP